MYGLITHLVAYLLLLAAAGPAVGMLAGNILEDFLNRPSRSQRRAAAKRARSERGRTSSRSAMAPAEPAPVRPLAVTQEQQDVRALAELRARRAEARRARVAQRRLTRECRRAVRASAYEDAVRRQDLLRREAALERAENLRRREKEVRRREEALAAPASPPLAIINLSAWGVGPQTQPLADSQALNQHRTLAGRK